MASLQKRAGTEALHGRGDHQQAAGGGSDAVHGAHPSEVYRKPGISENTPYRWRKWYGGMRVDQARRLKQLEPKHAPLKELLADSMLENATLKEAASGNS